MSTVEKPRKRYGWSETSAEEHAIAVVKEDYVEERIELDQFEERVGVILDEQPPVTVTRFYEGPLEELPCHLYGGDGGCLPKKRPGGRLEEILQHRARAPIAESPWANFAAQVVKFTGVRRAMPSNNPGEIRVAKGDHHCGLDAQDTVYVGTPVT